MIRVVKQKGWQGGESADDTQGPAKSFAYGRQVDFRSSSSLLRLQPQLAEESDGVVTDLIMDACLVPSGDIYLIGDSGNFYRRDIDTSEYTLITDFGQISGGSLVYRSDQDAILIPLQNKVASYGPISGYPSPPSLDVSKYDRSKSTDSAAYRSGGSQTYTLATSIAESDNTKCLITPDIEPAYSIKVNVITVGTGDWTITLHDDTNATLATSTIANANLSANVLNEFVLNQTARLLVKPNARTYHFHVTSTVADGTLACGTKNDLSTADFEFWANRFVDTNNALHTAIQFLQYTIYGNERYVAVHEPLEGNATNAEFQRHRLTLPSGFEVCGMALYREFVAIAFERKNTNGAIEFQNGLIVLWDGIDTTYNQVIPIPEGSPKSIFTYHNELYWHAGGSWYKLVGDKPYRIRRMPGATEEFGGSYNQIVMYPNMATVRHGVLLTGFPTNSINPNIEYAVYSLGSLDRTYDESFGRDFSLSTGSRTNDGINNLAIGMVKNLGDLMLVSWQDDSNAPTTYGVDSISPYSLPVADARIECLWFDNDQPENDQTNLKMKIVFNALPENATVTPIWRTERGAAWNNEAGTIQASEGDKAIVLQLNERSTEIQLGAIVHTDGDNVSIRTIALEFDDLSNEIKGLD